ncbi:periplasmic heavy metal sensor [Litoreibacter sp.]|nr:periplasmic heavy metal sensor [Litoreibacter sp.]
MSEDKAKSGRRWTRILLVISLGVNLLVLGMFAGAQFAGNPERSTGAKRGHSKLPIGPYGRAFSKEDRAELRKMFDARKPWFEQSRRQMRGFGQEMAEAVRSESFDAALISDILQRQSTVLSAFQAEGQNLLVDRITAMTPDQRAAFADRLEKGLKHGKRER